MILSWTQGPNNRATKKKMQFQKQFSGFRYALVRVRPTGPKQKNIIFQKMEFKRSPKRQWKHAESAGHMPPKMRQFCRQFLRQGMAPGHAPIFAPIFLGPFLLEIRSKKNWRKNWRRNWRSPWRPKKVGSLGPLGDPVWPQGWGAGEALVASAMGWLGARRDSVWNPMKKIKKVKKNAMGENIKKSKKLDAWLVLRSWRHEIL